MRYDGLKRLDIFKKNVTLTYKGREEFGTWVGFTMTILFGIVVLAKGLTDLGVVFSGEVKYVSTQMVYSDSDAFDRNSIVITKDKFFYEAGYRDGVPPEIGVIEFNHNRIENGVRTKTPIKTIPCALIPDYPQTLPNMECFDPERQEALTL